MLFKYNPQIILILLGWALGFAILNYVAKKLTTSLPTIAAESSLNILKYLIISPWLPVLILLYAYCALLYLFILRQLPISIACPIFLILGSFVTYGLGIVVFGEQAHWFNLLGLGLSIIGIIIMMWDSPGISH